MADITTDILNCIVKGTYSIDDGLTYFPGESVTALMEDLRDRGHKLRSHHPFTDDLKNLGFRVIIARQRMNWTDNPRACRAPCQCVTI